MVIPCADAIREATDCRLAAIWPFYREIVVAGETYAIDPEITEADARRSGCRHRLARPSWPSATRAEVVGSASAYPNRPARVASHVASASFMVDPRRLGAGDGTCAR